MFLALTVFCLSALIAVVVIGCIQLIAMGNLVVGVGVLLILVTIITIPAVIMLKTKGEANGQAQLS